MSITLPPELQAVLAEQARLAGSTPELIALEGLRKLYLPAASAPLAPGSPSMADYFADFISSIHSSEKVPGGAHLSENTGQKFAELLRKKR